MIRRGKLALVVAAVAVVLAACGGGGGDSGDANAQAPADPTAYVRVARDLQTTGGMQFDPVKTISGTNFEMQALVYGTLMTLQPDGGYGPGLAESATLVSPTQIDLTLKSGLVFSDGTPLDGAAVKAGLERTAASKGPGFQSDIFEISTVDVTDPTHVTIRTKSPTAGAVYALLPYPETFIVSPTAVAKGVNLDVAPVGAGPFTVEAFAPGTSLKMKKNPTYWNAASVQSAGLDFVNLVDRSPSVVTALLAHQVDVGVVTISDVDGLKSDPSLQVDVVSSANSYGQMYMCKSKPPFDDVRVRQALAYATDRQQIADLTQGGNGEPAWGLWPQGHIWYDADLDEAYPYDVDKARDLLAQAGYSAAKPLSFTAFFSNTAGQKDGEVLQAQWRKVGVDLQLVQTLNFTADFWQQQKQPAWVSSWSGTGTRRVARIYYPGLVSNVCNYSNPVMSKLIDELRALDPTSQAGIEKWKQIQEFEAENVLAVKWNFTPYTTAWNQDRLGGAEILANVFGNPTVDLTTVYVKASGQ